MIQDTKNCSKIRHKGTKMQIEDNFVKLLAYRTVSDPAVIGIFFKNLNFYLLSKTPEGESAKFIF